MQKPLENVVKSQFAKRKGPVAAEGGGNAGCARKKREKGREEGGIGKPAIGPLSARVVPLSFFFLSSPSLPKARARTPKAKYLKAIFEVL